MANQGIGKMHLDLYTSNNPLTHKAKFWCNYVGALKGKNPKKDFLMIYCIFFNTLALFDLKKY